MRQLHLVGITSDHEGLIFAAKRGAKSGGYVVTVDAALVDEIESLRQLQQGQSRKPAPPAPPAPVERARVESGLSPREMQARLRVGRTVAQVAAEAGVSVEWVERFAAPVMAEQAAAVSRAGRLTLQTPRRGLSDRPLADSVVRNLADRGVRLLDDEMASAWSAFQRAGEEWRVKFRYRHRGRDLDAEWILDLGSGTLTAANRLATELGFVDPSRHAPPDRDLPPPRVRRTLRAEAPGLVAGEAVPLARKRAGATRAAGAPKRAGPAKPAAAKRGPVPRTRPVVAAPPAPKRAAAAVRKRSGAGAGAPAAVPSRKRSATPTAKRATAPVAKRATSPVAKRATAPTGKRATAPTGKRAAAPSRAPVAPVRKRTVEPVRKRATAPTKTPVAPVRKRAASRASAPAESPVGTRGGTPAAGATRQRRAPRSAPPQTAEAEARPRQRRTESRTRKQSGPGGEAAASSSPAPTAPTPSEGRHFRREPAASADRPLRGESAGPVPAGAQTLRPARAVPARAQTLRPARPAPDGPPEAVPDRAIGAPTVAPPAPPPAPSLPPGPSPARQTAAPVPAAASTTPARSLLEAPGVGPAEPEVRPGPASVRIDTRPALRSSHEAPSTALRRRAEGDAGRPRRLRPLRANRIGQSRGQGNGSGFEPSPTNARTGNGSSNDPQGWPNGADAPPSATIRARRAASDLPLTAPHSVPTAPRSLQADP